WSSSQLGAESLAILNRRQKRLHHLGIDVVAIELIQFGQPEIVARVIRILWIVWVAAQVTKVLHQHERAIEFRVDQIRIFSDLSQRLSASGNIVRVRGPGEQIDGGGSFTRRQHATGVLVQLGDKGCGRHRRGKGGSKSRRLHKLLRECLLVTFEQLCPAWLQDNYSLADSLGAGRKLAEPNYRNRELVRAIKSRNSRGFAKRSLVHPLDQITRLLEFNRKEERSRDVNPTHFRARCIRAARGDLTGPEIPA